MTPDSELLYRVEQLERELDDTGRRLQEIERENLLLRRRAEAMGKSVLEGEEDRGRMLASLSVHVKQANELQIQRMNLSTQRDELHEERFNYVQKVLEQYEDRIRDLEIMEGSGERYSVTGLRQLAGLNTQARASMPPPKIQLVVEEKKPEPATKPVPSIFPMANRGYLWAAIAATATAIATGLGIAAKILFKE